MVVQCPLTPAWESRHVASDRIDADSVRCRIHSSRGAPGGRRTIEDAETRADLMRAIGEMVESNPDRPVLIGGYWRNELFDK